MEHREGQRHAEWLAGVIASATANWSGYAPEKGLEPKHFPLPLLQAQDMKRKRVHSRKKAEQELRAYFARKAAFQSGHGAPTIRIKGGPE
jgi:hypothetical protein